MISDKISTQDIVDLANGILKVTLPDYKAVEVAKNLVTRVKAVYPRKDGLTYTTSVDKSTNTITIMVKER